MEIKNTIKYYSYRAAYSRMNLAMKSGFYLEAIAIQESIISDRLLSFAVRIGQLVVTKEKLHLITFSKLIKISKVYFDNQKLVDALKKFSIVDVKVFISKKEQSNTYSYNWLMGNKTTCVAGELKYNLKTNSIKFDLPNSKQFFKSRF